MRSPDSLIISGSNFSADRMPEPGDVSPGFIAEADRCWRMVYDWNLQATHCAEPPA